MIFVYWLNTICADTSFWQVHDVQFTMKTAITCLHRHFNRFGAGSIKLSSSFCSARHSCQRMESPSSQKEAHILKYFRKIWGRLIVASSFFENFFSLTNSLELLWNLQTAWSPNLSNSWSFQYLIWYTAVNTFHSSWTPKQWLRTLVFRSMYQCHPTCFGVNIVSPDRVYFCHVCFHGCTPLASRWRLPAYERGLGTHDSTFTV